MKKTAEWLCIVCSFMTVCQKKEKKSYWQCYVLVMSPSPSIRDWVHHNENFVDGNSSLKIITFFSKYDFFFNFILCNFLVGMLIYFLKNIKKNFAPQNIEKIPSKVAHNPTRPPVFSLESLKSTISVVKNVPYKITNFSSRQI